MVTAEESQTCQQFDAWNSPCFDHMAPLLLEKDSSLPYFTPASTASIAFPGQPNSDLNGLNTEQLNAAGGVVNLLPPYPTREPCLEDSHCALPRRLGISDKPIDAFCIPQKRFLIFDQSRNHTRLFWSPSFSPQNQSIASKTPAIHSSKHEKVASQLDPQFVGKRVVEDMWDENHLTEGEMLEDSAEINALLYSDSDDEYRGDSDSDGENGEVTSMFRSPFCNEVGYDKDKLLEELMTGSDGSRKRQRLLDGGYKKSSLLSVDSPVEQASPCFYEADAESSCGGAREPYDDVESSNREKKVKVRDALKILEGIIPGLNSNDPLYIIEKAIAFLKSMRTEAEALGLSYPKWQSATSPYNLF